MKNSGSRTIFEFIWDPNLLENCDKFPTIHIGPPFLDYELGSA
jgi:hypothetical protein